MKLKIGGLLLLFSLFSLIAFAGTSAVSVKAGLESGNFFAEEEKIFDLVNQEREKRRLDSLEWNSRLADLARSYSTKMARENFFSHFDREGNSIADRAKAMKITRWRQIGENLFMCEGYDSFSQLAVKGWMKSSAHRANILEENYNQTGIGIARSRSGRIFVTQVFAEY